MNESSYTDTIKVREGEELNKGKLQDFIQNHVEDAPSGSLEIEQFGSGHSNLTYLLKIGEWEAVLRRPPLGPVAPKAHDMNREYNIIDSIYPVFPVAPKPYIFSEDETIIGSPFFIMGRKKGIVLNSCIPDWVNYDSELGRKISELMVDKLVELHQIDYTKTSMADITNPNGFMERQVTGWIKRYEKSKTNEIQGVAEVTKWLEKNIPVSPYPSIIHYDYKLNNAMFSNNFSEMVGLFDWEMTTVGDPLADLGVALSYWVKEDDPDELKNGFGESPVTIKEGFFTRDEFIQSYAIKSGRDLSNINFYLTFAYFKLAVICQQIYFRYKKGQTNDQRFAHLGEFVSNLIQISLSSSKCR
jgi:aminoglycoside phosphotransferase (APT) family kinase protein